MRSKTKKGGSQKKTLFQTIFGRRSNNSNKNSNNVGSWVSPREHNKEVKKLKRKK